MSCAAQLAMVCDSSHAMGFTAAWAVCRPHCTGADSTLLPACWAGITLQAQEQPQGTTQLGYGDTEATVLGLLTLGTVTEDSPQHLSGNSEPQIPAVHSPKQAVTLPVSSLQISGIRLQVL